jgi:uncharacterized membrane protein
MTIAAVRGTGWSGAVVVVSLVLLVTARVDPLDESWRAIAAAVFVLLAPGASLVPLVGLRDTGVELALVVPFSIATVILTAVALFYTNSWTPDREFAVLVGICAVGVATRTLMHVIVLSPRTDRESSTPANPGTAASGSGSTKGGM